MPTWKLEDAKNQFSRVVREALMGKPQRVTRGGRDAVVIVSAEEYDRLTRATVDLVDFLRESPLAEVELDLERSRELGRRLEL
ncbi:MAG: type II toxin-antitoxin system Phd/YefM family antitoxin [Pseudonocardiales bacterium]|nr:type II toxin-antitoxin system Phd/YefM family antitoxin [Pseudonocardiales bacterium]